MVGKINTVIIGAGGMLGQDLGKVYGGSVKLRHSDLDITKKNEVMYLLEGLEPSLVINAAAYTNVDGCEDNLELAYDVNGRAPGYIAEACQKIGAKLVHYSTDYVFDGSKKEYIESDSTNPINVYGKSKLAGERNIAAFMNDYRIIRTSWLFGHHGRNFVETMLALSKQMDTVKVVNDQFGKPTYTMDLAKKTPEIVSMEPGIYHITNDGICSWYEFAKAIIPNVSQCTSQEYPRKAKRPAYSVLKNTKTGPMRPWKEALAEYLELRKSGGT